MDIKSKNKVLFIADIALLDEEFVYDDHMISVMSEFILNYYHEYTDEFNLVFDVVETEDTIDIELFNEYEEYEEIMHFASHLDDGVSFKYLFDDIGDKNALKIGKLAMLFCSFCRNYDEMMNNTLVKIRQ